MDEFWENGEFFVPGNAGSLDTHLSGNSTVQDHVRPTATEVLSGTRVAFTGTLSALLMYQDPPSKGASGTVVMCRTAAGDTPMLDGLVFVKWDDGRFLPVHVAYLRRLVSPTRTATNYRRRVIAMGDLTDFLKSAGGMGDLIHKSSKDLWKLTKSGGDFVIERLFDEDGEPLKV